ncbi:MFS transporter [Cupriavidus sp. USMAHM13]|uniref:MFS transporter n=1 Tax=Cupriavidus sp. USMAHM13 TaxID=1389192 RepID=UPI0008A70573|nr:MFS transporter [Cupriavidus sp. USMAHM13]AOZ02223.1 MFS transporter [Cupriavidus sp. USMAHM13]
MRQIDANRLADDASFNRFHATVLVWCALAIVFDGYDLAVAGIALPAIMKEMGVDATQAGFMVSSALFGMMFGNIVFGALADRIGRRAVIVLCIALFSLCTAAAGMMHEPVAFSVMRFLAGLGMGGVMPNVIAQMSEYAPRRMRSTLITVMFSGYSVGGIVAALVGRGLIESYGWQGVFLAAAAPAVLLPWIWRQMPESMAFLHKRGRTSELQAILARLAPQYAPQADDVFVVASQDKPQEAPLRTLFAEGRGFSTVMFWVTCFMSLFMVYALNAWLVKLMASAGYSLGSALAFVLVLNLGATAGAIGGGWLADRLHIKGVLVPMFLLAAVSIALLGHGMPTWVLFVLVGVAGACTIGTQTLSCAYCGQFYPLACRGTGLGLMLGVGRAGAILAPILIGAIIGLSLPLAHNFLVIAVPAVIAAASIALVNHGRSDLVRQRTA